MLSASSEESPKDLLLIENGTADDVSEELLLIKNEPEFEARQYRDRVRISSELREAHRNYKCADFCSDERPLIENGAAGGESKESKKDNQSANYLSGWAGSISSFFNWSSSQQDGQKLDNDATKVNTK